MSKPYAYFADLAEDIQIPEDGTLSRTIYRDDSVTAVLFGFAPGQELTEHTSSMPAIIYLVKGEADLTLGGDPVDGKAGTWIHMPAQLPHSVYAKTEVVMLLLMFRSARKASS